MTPETEVTPATGAAPETGVMPETGIAPTVGSAPGRAHGDPLGGIASDTGWLDPGSAAEVDTAGTVTVLASESGPASAVSDCRPGVPLSAADDGAVGSEPSFGRSAPPFDPDSAGGVLGSRTVGEDMAAFA